MIKFTTLGGALKHVTKIVDALTTEARLKFEPEGFKIIAIDPGKVSAAIIKIGADTLEDYSADEMELGLDFTKVKNALKMAKEKDVVTVEFLPEEGVMRFNMGRVYYDVPVIMGEAMPEGKELDLKPPARATMASEDVVKVIQAAATVGDYLQISIGPDGVTMRAKGERGRAGLRMGPDELLDLEADQEYTSTFSVSYLKKIATTLKASDTVTLYVGNDMPLRMDFEVKGAIGSVSYYQGHAVSV